VLLIRDFDALYRCAAGVARLRDEKSLSVSSGIILILHKGSWQNWLLKNRWVETKLKK